MIEKVISGGQTGADIAGLRAAKACGIPTGGFIPKGYKTLDGLKPQYEDEFNLVAIDTSSYAERTRLNVLESDCTIRFAFDYGSPGELCTLRNIRGYVKPYKDISTRDIKIGTIAEVKNGNIEYVDTSVALQNWLIENNFRIINIAGNSEKTYPGIERLVYVFLTHVFEEANNLTVI